MVWDVSHTHIPNDIILTIKNVETETQSFPQGCREPCLGWLELSVNYSEADHTLDCSLLRARDLPAMDAAGHADPFCKINIITEYGAKQQKWFFTKTVHKTTNPEFNEKVRFLGVEPDELIGGCTLYVVILDDDHYGHDFLGAAKINLSQVSIPFGYPRLSKFQLFFLFLSIDL